MGKICKYILICFIYSHDDKWKNFGESNTIQDLRRKIMETLFDNTEINAFLIPSEDNVADIDPTAWYDSMTKDGTWCDHPFMLLTSIYLKKELVVLSIYPEDSPNGKHVI